MNRFGRLFGGAAILIVLGLIGLGLFNFRAIDDWLKLRDYDPPAAVADIASKDKLTPEARRIFYINHPKLITSTAAFRQDCPTYEQTIVLGCYHSNQNGIFLYDVKDRRLDGVVEVTSAHEMLHGAFDRLSQSDKDKITGWLADFYKHDLRDQRIRKSIEAYKKTEPKDVLNEMHSVFGTEVNNLTPQLETYYERYFTKRQTVVAFSGRYEAEFTRRLGRIDDYERQIKMLKHDISGRQAALTRQLADLQSERARLDSLQASGRTAEYNAAVPGFNADVAAYNSSVTQLRLDIAHYNELVAAHNSLAAELRSLYSSLDSNLTTQSIQ